MDGHRLPEAAYLGSVQVVVVFLTRGADPHVQTYDGETPIQLINTPTSWISEESQAQTIQLLSERHGREDVRSTVTVMGLIQKGVDFRWN